MLNGNDQQMITSFNSFLLQLNQQQEWLKNLSEATYNISSSVKAIIEQKLVYLKDEM
jgi:hypothetical protein